MKREFTGVFIPAHIWTSKLLPAEKMLLGEISALSTKTGWCDASRAHFAEWLHCDPTNVTHFIKKLENLGYLEVSRMPGYRSKMRVKIDAFYVGVVNDNAGGVVNPIHGGSEPHSRVVVNPIHGGSEPHSPEIKDKYNNKRKEESENAPAPEVEQSTLNTPFRELPAGAGADGPRWQDVPNSNTPREFETYLTGFYANHPQELEYIRERTQFQNNPTGVPTAIADFCAWAVGEGWNRRTLQQINARLGRWLREQKRFDASNNTKPGVKQAHTDNPYARHKIIS